MDRFTHRVTAPGLRQRPIHVSGLCKGFVCIWAQTHGFDVTPDVRMHGPGEHQTELVPGASALSWKNTDICGKLSSESRKLLKANTPVRAGLPGTVNS